MMLFSSDQLKQIVTKTLATVPDQHTNAIVGTVDAAGTQVLVSFKLKDKWTAQGVIRHDWTGDTSGAASVIYSW